MLLSDMPRCPHCGAVFVCPIRYNDIEAVMKKMEGVNDERQTEKGRKRKRHAVEQRTRRLQDNKENKEEKMKRLISKKLIALILTILGNYMVSKSLPPEIVSQILTSLNMVAAVYLLGQSVDDAVMENKKPEVIRNPVKDESPL